jgi:membrane-associated phospholipid phosphatase
MLEHPSSLDQASGGDAARADRLSRASSVRPAADDPTGPRLPRALWTRRRALALLLGYAVGLGGMIAARGLFRAADRYFLILLVPALVLGVAVPYVRDFLPFVVLIIFYEELRGLAHVVNPDPYYAPMIEFDRALFGRLPTTILQDLLWQGSLQWYDQVLAVVQRAHFIVPPTLLFLIWLERRELYYRCALALLLVSFAGALTFLVFPAAPPWKASETGRIEHVVKVGDVQDAVPVRSPRSWIESRLHPNPVAAVPSLHTAYSLLVVLFGFAWRRRVGQAFLVYPALMWFTIVYFADHYVIDIVVGVIYAVVAWVVAGRLLRRGGPLRRLAGPHPPPLAAAHTFGGPTA